MYIDRSNLVYQSEGEGPGTDYLSSWVRGDVGAWYGRRVVLRNPYTWGGPVPPLFFEIHVQGGVVILD